MEPILSTLRRQRAAPALLGLGLLALAHQPAALAHDTLPNNEVEAIRQVLEADADSYRLAHREAKSMLENIDWSGVERLEIRFDDNLFEPEDVHLKRHTPYRITLTNVGFESHDIAGEHLFSSMVVKKVRSADLEVEAHHLERLVIRPKAQLELWLIPTNTGRIDFVCTIPGHLEEGMAGHLIIRD